MVVIEPVSTGSSTEENRDRKKLLEDDDYQPAAAREASASDGFETASDGEHDDLGKAEADTTASQERQDSRQEEALSEDQLIQRTLTQVNDAKLEGNKLFGAGQYEEALAKYELALHAAPDKPEFVEIRSICHANRATCFSKLRKYEDAIKESTKALELNPGYAKALNRRAEAHEKLEHFDEAIADLKKILELEPSNVQASRTIRHLEPKAELKREKMKEEMIDLLTEENYVSWSRSMQRALRARSKIRFINGDFQRPTDPADPLLDAWERCNDLV
ncbi:Tetratricopeptide repeat 1, partial [Dillenia turbinata]